MARDLRPDAARSLTLVEVGSREFTILEPSCRYRLSVAGGDVTFEFDRARWDGNELTGELIVRTAMLGTDAVNGGVLSWANFNASSARARSDRANIIARAAKDRDGEYPWAALLEDFCQGILAAERTGEPSIDLRTVEADPTAPHWRIHGLALPRRHPAIVFGDGGTLKSYLGLFLAGELRREGLRVGYADWELEAEDHKARLAALYTDDLPEIRYVRCARPLVHEVDRLRRVVEEQGLDYFVCDSIAFACDGPPEAAEVASRYFQAVRQLRVGSLHIAHITKGENGDQRPFGSTFWHNGCRAAWFAKAADSLPGSQTVSVGLFPRKWNLSGQPPATGFEFVFGPTGTTCRPANVADMGELAERLPIRQRMAQIVRSNPMLPDRIADELGADVETVKRTARRYRQQFTVVTGGAIGLLERHG